MCIRLEGIGGQLGQGVPGHLGRASWAKGTTQIYFKKSHTTQTHNIHGRSLNLTQIIVAVE